MRILFHGLLVLAIILGFFAFPYDPGVLAIAGCIAAVVALGWLAKKIPNISPTQRILKVSWKILVPLGFSVPTIFFFLFTSALIPLAVGTMIVGAILVLGYERLLTRWARRGFSDLQKLGLMTGALGFFAVFFGSHPRILRETRDERPRGRLRHLPSLDKEEDHPATPAEPVQCSTWIRNARTNRPRRKIAGYEKPSERFRALFL
jgi:hypothetical protein